MLFSASKPDLLLYLAACAAVPRALSAPPTPPPRPLLRAAGRSIRPLRGSADFSCPRTADCVLLAGVQVGDGGASGTIIAFIGSIVAMPITHSPHSLRAAGRSIRPLRVEIACLFLCRTRCIIAVVRRVKGGDGESEQGFVHEIGREKDDDKEDKKKARNGAYRHHLNFSVASQRP